MRYDFIYSFEINSLVVSKFSIKNYKILKNERIYKWLINYFCIFNKLDILPTEIIYYILNFLSFTNMDIASRKEIIKNPFLITHKSSIADRYDIDFVLSLSDNYRVYRNLIKDVYNQYNKEDIKIIKRIIIEKYNIKYLKYFYFINIELDIRLRLHFNNKSNEMIKLPKYCNKKIYKILLNEMIEIPEITIKTIPHYFIDNGVKWDIMRIKNTPVKIRKRYLKNNQEVINNRIREFINNLNNYFNKKFNY